MNSVICVNRTRRSRKRRLMWGAITLLTACGGGGTEPAPTGTPTTHSVTSIALSSVGGAEGAVVGGTVQLTATVYDEQHAPMSGQVVTYASGDTTRAKVSSTGLVTGFIPGSVGITASVGSVVSPSFALTITPAATNVRWVDVAAGFSHSCGLTTAGIAYCWGSDQYGALGGPVSTKCNTLTAGDSVPCSSVPVRVNTGQTFVHIFAGSSHTCGLTAAGAAYCWGLNSSGQLGSGDTTSTSTPRRVATVVAFASLSLGASDACGVSMSGVAYCWGNPLLGELGTGTLSNSNVVVPTPVAGNLTFKSIASTLGATCGLTTTGAAYCWGGIWQPSADGANTLTVNPFPQPVPGNLVFVHVALNTDAGCGLRSQGDIYCWGANHYGSFGNGTTTPSVTPVPVNGMGYTTLLAGQTFLCASTTTGASCWGQDAFGQLAVAATEQCGTAGSTNPVAACATRPQPIPLMGISALTGGNSHACAVTATQELYCWGNNFLGQLGSGTRNTSPTPARVAAPVDG